MGWKQYQTVDHPKREPQVGSGLYPSINSSLQIAIFQIHQIFNISYFLQFNLSIEKNSSFPKCPKITQKCTQNRQTVVMAISIEIQRCLKRDRDIGRKVVLSDVIPVQSRAHGSLVRTTDRQFFVTSGNIFEVQSFLRTTESFCQIY